uniref:MDR-like ABC transporter n=1 Tax=Oryza punctata TaxID=4537 RepID=A0A0E0L5B3_ORYPU
MAARGSEGGEEEAEGKVGLHRLFSYADGVDALLMAAGAAGAAASGAAQPLMNLVFGEVVDAFGSGSRDDVLHRVCLKFFYLAIGSWFACFLQVACWMITGERQAARIRGLYLEAVLRQDIAFFEKEMTTGQVVERMSGDTILIQDAIGEKVGKFIQLTATFVGGFVVSFAKGWLLSCVMLSSIPPIIIAGATMSWTISKLSTHGQSKYIEAGNVVEQTIGAIRTVASFSGENRAIALYNKYIHSAYVSAVQESTATGLGFGFIMFMLFCTYGLAAWYGAKLIIDKGYEGGQVVTVWMAFMTGAMSLGEATPCMSAFASGQAAGYRMMQTIERMPAINSSGTDGVVLENIKGDIELRNVYFSYPSRPDQLIFDGFSLHVLSGITMAIVGESGSGKSTAINLVERFYDPQAGEVLIDGVNIKTLRLRWIREKIGLVSQEPLLFATSIRENIVYGREDATTEEIMAATELANAAKFIENLPNGLDTMVGEHGAQLSGGQKQRIAIARAILKNPKILLLDEATSALDMESERVVQEALNRIMQDKTTIVVAHRLSTIKDADIISVVQQGRVVEQGLNPSRTYHLIQLQGATEELHKSGVDYQRSISTVLSVMSISKSRSCNASFKRSLSRGTSFGSTSVHLTTAAGMVVPESMHTEVPSKVLDDIEEHNKVPLCRLISLNKPEIPVLLLGTAAAVVAGVLFPMLGLLISSSIKSFYEPPHQLKKDARFWTFMYVAAGIVSLISLPVENFLFGVAGGKLVERIRSLSFKRIVHQEVSWFDNPSNASGTIGARLSVDASNIRRLVGDSLALIVRSSVTIIAGFIIAMVANWRLALVATVVLPLGGLQGFFQIKFLEGFSADAKVKYEEATQVAHDAVSSIRTVASFCAENRIMKAYYKKCEAPVRQGIRQGIVSGLGFGISYFVLYSTYALCFYVGAKFMLDGKATFTEIFRVFFALLMATIGVSQTSAMGSDSAKAKASASSIFAMIDRESKIDSSSDDGIVLADVTGELELHHVCFSYPSRPDIQIFRDMSLRIPSGKLVALVGESGCGKSTVIALLERFYDPDSGTVTLDGVDIKNLKVGFLRQQMGLVSQEPVLFNDTVRANIAYGKEGDATEEEIIAAAKAANAHQFISALPRGYDTCAGERGVQLSGGQKQRVAIARAILKDPRILLLDEATSALDAESEHAVQAALESVMIGRTTVVVAHRLSTIRGADVIAVLKNGEVVATGRHEQLMAKKDGVYASLVELRMSSERAGDSKPSQSMEEASTARAADGDKCGKEENGRRMAKDGKVAFHHLFKYADRTDVALMLVGTIASLASGMSQVIMTIIFGQMVDAFGKSSPGNILHQVNKAVLYFVYLGIGSGIVCFLQVSCWAVTGERQATRIRSLYLKTILRQDMAFFDKEMTTGQVISSISADTTLIQGAIGEKVGKFLQLVTTFLGGFVLAFIKGWLLTLIMLSTIPPFIFAAGIVSKMLAEISSEGLASYSKAGDIVEQTVGSIRTVVSFNGEKKAIGLYNDLIKKAYKGAVKEGFIQGFGMGFLNLIYFSSFGLIVWYGSKLSLSRGYSGADIMNILFGIMIGARSLGDATPCTAAFEEGRIAAYRLFKIIKRKPEIDYDDTNGIVLQDIKGDIELKDVFFSYPSRSEQLIFDGFSMYVSNGTTMAIVGESGSGKSTVINLVERFYDPHAGEVLIDGMNIKSLRLEWIRGKIGLVNQEPILFMTSIKDNILYGKEDATLEEIKRAAELANAARFIESMPNGYDTLVGQRGAQLSGGQKQRIAIARAILKNPKILLLDEATSALDLESERIVQDALNQIMVGRTTLVVAHRLSTVRNAHCISVVYKGKIAEQGHHDELVKDPNGAYSQLIRLQEAQQAIDSHLDGPLNKRSQSLKRSLSRNSAGSTHSLNRPFSLRGATELLEYDGADSENHNLKNDGKLPKKGSMGRLISLNKPEIAIILFGSLAAAIDGAVFPMIGLVLASAVKVFYESPDKREKDATFWGLLCVGMGAIAMISKLANILLFAIAGGKLIKRIRALTFRSIVHQEVSWFDHPANSSGALGGKLCVDALNGYAQVRFLQGFSQDAKIMYEEASQVATDAVGSIRTVASYCAEKKVMTKYNQKCQASRYQGIRTGIVGGLGFGFSYMMLFMTSALCYYVGAKFVSQGNSTFGDVFKAFFSLVVAMLGVSSTAAMASDSSKAKDSASSIFAILDRKSQIDSSSNEGLTLELVKGDIEFTHISFRYPSRPDVQIFSDFTLSIPSGKTVALVGQSGSGKSTAIALLERFYDPDSGVILLDGVEIKKLEICWLRDQMGLVSQEPVLFNDTIHANIAYGKNEDVTEEEIVAAAKAANAHEFISSMQQGYSTSVGERGTQLAGGQKQRIAIARAIVKDPRILLLDEATSALDAESERIVQDALDHVMVGRTTIVVAHRLSTIQGADIIAVLKDGAIVEKGRHEALMGIAGGSYASLVELRHNVA